MFTYMCTVIAGCMFTCMCTVIGWCMFTYMCTVISGCMFTYMCTVIAGCMFTCMCTVIAGCMFSCRWRRSWVKLVASVNSSTDSVMTWCRNWVRSKTSWPLRNSFDSTSVLFICSELLLLVKLFGSGTVILPCVCLSVCLFIGRITQNITAGFSWNLGIIRLCMWEELIKFLQ